MSPCDYDLLSVSDSLDGFPGQTGTSAVAHAAALDVHDNLLAIEAWRETARAAANEGAWMMHQATVTPTCVAYDGPYGTDAYYDALDEMHDATPLFEPGGCFEDWRNWEFANDSSSDSMPLLAPTRPSSPVSDYAIDGSIPGLGHPPSVEEFHAMAANDATLYGRDPALVDSTGNALALTLYVPPGRRQCDQPRIFYPTLIPGVFDTETPSEKRTAEFMAERIAENCLSVAMSPQELANKLAKLDDTVKLELFNVTRALRLEVPGASESKRVVRIRRCAVHIYGFDFECETEDGRISWQRDIDLRFLPDAQRLIFEFWENSSRTLSCEQINRLRALPQYAFAEGARIFEPMLRRAVSENVAPARAYV